MKCGGCYRGNSMVKTCIVTGFTPITDHPRKEEEYHRLAEQFDDIGYKPLTIYKTPLGSCWLQDWMDNRPHEVEHSLIVSRGDNPAKNTQAYHVVQHQKTEWLRQATLVNDV